MNRSSLTPADCIYLTGPTASGKTTLGLELAKPLGAEIISLDSMAIYRGMDIGTAKPSAAERAEVRHHLIDIVEPSEDYSLAQYVDAARAAVAQIAARGRAPLFVGGTPLYLKALLRGIFEGPPADWEFRRELLAIAESKGPAALHARLAQVDAGSAARLHAADTRRVIRALEVYEKTGRSITQLQRQFDLARPAEACRVFVLDWPRTELVHRIDQRVERMFAAGLAREVQTLLDQPQPMSRTAKQAVGYREVIEHLENKRGIADTIELVKLRTRQFAKRQMTWFRSLSECRFVSIQTDCNVEEIARQILSSGQ